MKKIFLGVFLAGLAVSLGIFLWQTKTGQLKAKEINPGELQQMIEQDDDFFVYFYSDTCPECVKAEPEVARAVKITKVNIVKLNVRQYEEIKKELQIMGTPTIYYYKNHKLASGITGYQNYHQYVDYFKKTGALS